MLRVTTNHAAALLFITSTLPVTTMGNVSTLATRVNTKIIKIIYTLNHSDTFDRMEDMKPESSRRGRPKLEADKQLKARHVVNLTPEQDAAVRKYCQDFGIGHHVDGMRQLIVRALKAEGYM